MRKWHVSREDGGTKIKDAKGNTVLWTQRNYLCGRRTENQVMAIANLAAAAPEMLDLLNRAAEADSQIDDVRTAWWEARAAALAKAGGAS